MTARWASPSVLVHCRLGPGSVTRCRQKPACGGEHHGTGGDDPGACPVPRRPYIAGPTRTACAPCRFTGRGYLQDRLRAGIARGNSADRLGVWPLSSDRDDRCLGAAQGAQAHHHGVDAAGRYPGGGGLHPRPYLHHAEASDARRRQTVGGGASASPMAILAASSCSARSWDGRCSTGSRSSAEPTQARHRSRSAVGGTT